MVKGKKRALKKTAEIAPAWRFNWNELDRTFDNFRRDMERAFSSFPSMTFPSMPHLPIPSSTSCDVVDEGDRLCIDVDLPGVKRSDIDLNITNNSVEISAGHKEQSEEKKKNFLRKERSEVSYYRTLPLPEKVVSGKAKAKLTEGVLHIQIPKAVPTPKPKKRSIKVQ